VAVLGLYSSGSTATAGVLHHLGVCLGRQFWGDYFEARWLSDQLRRWWNEPDLREVVAREQRVGQLAQWLHDMESTGAAAVGAKHPLLVLSGDDLCEAWGAETKFLWAWRPLDESIASLERRGWWPGKERDVQNRLWDAALEFFARQNHLQVVFGNLLQNPEREMGRIIEFLGLQPAEARQRAAANSIRRRELPTV
jgi:phage gp46-like protein